MGKPDLQLYLVRAYTIWRDTGKRPTARDIERALAGAGEDYLRVAQRARQLYGDGIPIEEWNAEVRLPLRALLKVPRAHHDFDVLVRAFPVMKSIYEAAKNEPWFSADDLRRAGWNATDIRTIGQMLDEEYILHGSSQRTSWDDWKYVLSPNLLEFTDARTGQDYIARRVDASDKEQRRADKGFRFMGRPRFWHRLGAFLGRHVVGAIGTVVVGLIVAYLVYLLGWNR